MKNWVIEYFEYFITSKHKNDWQLLQHEVKIKNASRRQSFNSNANRAHMGYIWSFKFVLL